MIPISKIRFPLDQIIGTAQLVLLHARPLYRYESGVATKDVVGTVYEVVEMSGDFNKFNVKVQDTDMGITEDEIQTSSKPLYVDFINPVCKLYVDKLGHIQVSVSADSIVTL